MKPRRRGAEGHVKPRRRGAGGHVTPRRRGAEGHVKPRRRGAGGHVKPRRGLKFSAQTLLLEWVAAASECCNSLGLPGTLSRQGPRLSESQASRTAP